MKSEPSILLLDESFAALDAELRSNMRSTVRRICKELNQTVIFVIHDQQEAVIMGDRIAMMMDGKITQCDRPDVFYHRPVSKKVASFFGWSNSVSAVQDGNTIKCQIGEFIIESAEPYMGDVELMIHSQSAYYSEDGRYSAKVIWHSYLGTSSDYDVEINQTKLTIQLDNRHLFSDGDLMKLDFDMNMIWPVPVSSDDGDDQGHKESLEERGGIKRLLSRIKKRK